MRVLCAAIGHADSLLCISADELVFEVPEGKSFDDFVAELWAACGFATEKNHPWAIDKWATWRFSRLTPDVTDELGGIIEFEPNLSARDAVTSEPAPFVMVFRMNVLLRGNAMSLGDLNVDAARHWRPAAVRLLKRHGENVPKTRPNRGMKERLDEQGRVVKA